MISVQRICQTLLDDGIKAELQGNPDVMISGFSSLFHYRPGTMTFIVPERDFSDYQSQFQPDGISLFMLSVGLPKPLEAQAALYVEDPKAAFFRAIELLFDRTDSEEVTGITSDPKQYRANSFISPSAEIGEGVKIGVGCVIEGGVKIGDGTAIHHQVTIRTGTKIGKNCTIFSGARIGERGYNYLVGPKREKYMMKHYGGVTIGDDVHIGENVCISRGMIDDTVICDGVKIDALTHIAHNCVIGRDTLILGPASVSGSAEIGEDCHIAATIIRNQVTVGKQAMLGLGSVVVKDIPENVIAYGNPAKPVRKRFE